MKGVYHLLALIIATNLLVCFPYVTFSQVANAQPDERLVINTDRDIYIAGEELVFSVDILKIDDKTVESKVGYVLLRNSNQEVIFSIMIRFIEGRAWSSIILPDTLSSGYFQLITFTNYLRNFSCAAYSSKQIVIANRFDKEIKVFTLGNDSLPKQVRPPLVEVFANKDTFKPLEKGQISIKAVNEPVKVCVSVVPMESFIGNITYFNNTNIEFKNTFNCYPKETKGIYLSGFLNSKENNKPVPNVIMYLSTPDSLVNLQFTKTDLNGYFSFHLSYAYLNRKVFVVPDIYSITEEVDIKIDDKCEVLSPFIPQYVKLSEKQIEFIKKSQNVILVQKLFQNSPYTAIDPNGIDRVTLPRVYSRPQYEYYLSNYQPLNNLREIFREIIPQVRLRGKGEDQNFYVMNTQESYKFFSSPPMVFLNGMPYAKPLSLLNYSSNEIDFIGVTCVPWYFGEKPINGIVSIFLNSQINTADLFNKGYSKNFIQPFAFHVEFDVEQLKNSIGIPDFRQTLLWKPSISVSSDHNSNIDFTASHLQGNYIVIVNGIDKYGTLFQETVNINVKD
ncbi:MAG: hypothetical protein RBT74_07005 [Tenuifilaceae bacterium]|jgi:hypothetical protein|nr:hypothetical protein [Tenuifilaceae bacterium]